MLKRQGGLTFWRIGRLGGSIYIARRKPAPRPDVRTYAATLASYRPEPLTDWRNDSPYRAGFVVIGLAFAFVVAAWLAIGLHNGFI